MKKFVKRAIITIAVVCLLFSLPEIFHKNKGLSISSGKLSNGKLSNAYLVPFWGKNYRYFSAISYYLMNNAYTNSQVYHTILAAYKECESTCPDVKFQIMECSDKHGGKLSLHRTHQNGMSIDFMSPKKRNGTTGAFWNHIGLFHYLLEFDSSGHLNMDGSTEIDFEAMGRHILALHNAARENNLRISKVILKLNLKDDLFQTDAGKQILKEGIYFAKSLPKWTNKMHDDHYHIDFVSL